MAKDAHDDMTESLDGVRQNRTWRVKHPPSAFQPRKLLPNCARNLPPRNC